MNKQTLPPRSPFPIVSLQGNDGGEPSSSHTFLLPGPEALSEMVGRFPTSSPVRATSRMSDARPLLPETSRDQANPRVAGSTRRYLSRMPIGRNGAVCVKHGQPYLCGICSTHCENGRGPDRKVLFWLDIGIKLFTVS
jgi:hypothetical protein